eukprot:1152131-Pelagomonas_calceolata.AAC.4
MSGHHNLYVRCSHLFARNAQESHGIPLTELFPCVLGKAARPFFACTLLKGCLAKQKKNQSITSHLQQLMPHRQRLRRKAGILSRAAKGGPRHPNWFYLDSRENEEGDHKQGKARGQAGCGAPAPAPVLLLQVRHVHIHHVIAAMQAGCVAPATGSGTPSEGTLCIHRVAHEGGGVGCQAGYTKDRSKWPGRLWSPVA